MSKENETYEFLEPGEGSITEPGFSSRVDKASPESFYKM